MRTSITILRTCVFTAASLSIVSHSAAAPSTQVDLKSQAKGADFSRAVLTKPFRTGTSLPATCSPGEAFFNLSATSGQNWFACTALNVWTLESGGSLPSFSGNADRLLGTNGTAASWLALGGDVSGSPQTLQVSGLRGRTVASTTPTDGQVLRWNAAMLNWEPGTVSANGTAGSGTTNTGGDLAGPVGAATVTRLQNKPLSAASPADGQVLTWSQSSGQWVPQTLSGATTGSSGTVTPTSASLSVLGVQFSSATTLTIGSNCSLATPCNVRFGNNVIAVTTSSTVTWQSGTGTLFIYVTGTGTVTVGSNLGLTCSGCVAATGISAFPFNTIPIYTWNALSTGFDPASGHDTRAYLSSKLLSSGQGVLLIESGQQSTIAVDTTLIPTYTTGASSLAFGTLAANSCSADLALAVPGANVGDAVAPGWPAVLPASVLGQMRVTAVNIVAVRLCNLSGSQVTIAASSYRATVVRGL